MTSRALFFGSAVLSFLMFTGAGHAVGVGVTLDSERVVPIQNENGDFVYLAKFLCGTIADDPFNPQIPDQNIVVGENNLVPGTYLTKLNINNPSTSSVTLVLSPPLIAVGGQIVLPPLPGGRTTLDCRSIVQGFDPIQPFREFEVVIVATDEVNMIAVQSLKNVVEDSPVFTVFYECIPGPTTSQGATFSELSTLVLTNQGLVQAPGQMVFFDGNGNVIATSPLLISALDVDEINLCRTLFLAGITPPRRGFILIIFDFIDIDITIRSIHCWIIDFVGKFFVTSDSPSDGRIVAIGKTTCWGGFIALIEILDIIAVANAPVIGPVLINDTSP